MKTSSLSDEAINNLQYKEELEDIINEAYTGLQLQASIILKL